MKEIIGEIKKYKKYIFNAFYAFVTFLAFLIYFKIIFSYDSYNLLLTLLYFLLFVFYNKYGTLYKKSDKRTRIISCISSIIISIILIIGSLVSSHVSERIGLIFNLHTIIYGIVGVFGFYLILKNVFAFIFKNLPVISTFKNAKMSKKAFMALTGLFIVCWLPYFLRFFPAVMTPDSYYILHYVQNGELNDFHVFGYTWFVGVIYLLGNILFHNSNIAVAFYVIIQMFICALIFSYMIKFIYEKGIKKIYLIILTLFMILSPLFAFYSITLWRDILFGMAFITLFISLYKFVNDNYEFKLNTVLMYILSILVILFFRNNGIYVFLLFIPFLILFTKNKRLVIGLANLAIVIIYFVIKGPIFNYFGVEKTTSVEAFSMPLQQIARVIVNDGDIDKKTYEYISGIMDVSKVKETYDPSISDFVKRASNNDKISENKIKFFQAWFKIGINNPRIYIDSYLSSTLGYWYPDVIYWATAGESKSIFDDVKVSSKPIIKFNTDYLTSRKLPLASILWSIGTMFIVLVASTFIMIYKRKTKYLVAYIPLYCLWFTLMIASPVFAELRYIYGLFACIPLLLFVPFIDEEKKKIRGKKNSM